MPVAAAKMVAVSFYFGEVNRAAFQARFGRPFELHYAAALEYALDRGLMVETPDTFSLTAAGATHFNGVIALFFAPSVQEYLLRQEPASAQDLHRARRSLRVAGGVAR